MSTEATAPRIPEATVEADEVRLRELRVEITRVESALAVLRSERDDEIKRRVSEGMAERRAARAANVSPSYAHKAAVHGRMARRIR